MGLVADKTLLTVKTLKLVPVIAFERHNFVVHRPIRVEFKKFCSQLSQSVISAGNVTLPICILNFVITEMSKIIN